MKLRTSHASPGRAPEPIPEPLKASTKSKLPPGPRFLLKAHPHRWDVIGGRVLPVLGRVVLVPGIGMIDRHGRSKAALADQQERGWTIIPEDVEGPGTTYLRVHDVESGGITYLTKWETCYAGSTRVVCADPDGYADFLQGLIDRGVIEPIRPDVLEVLIERRADELGEYRDKAQNMPSYGSLVEMGEARLAVLEAARVVAPSAGRAPEPVVEPAEPDKKPKRKRRAKAKATPVVQAESADAG